MPPRSPLKQLRRLDETSTRFPDQVNNILYGEDYTQWVPTIQGDDLVGLYRLSGQGTLSCLASSLLA